MTRSGRARRARRGRRPAPPARSAEDARLPPERPKEGALDVYAAIVGFLSRVAGAVAAGLIGMAVLVVCDMVIERYFLNRTTVWQIDVVTYSIVGAAFVGSAYVLMLRGHVNVDVLPLHLGPRARYGLALFTSATALAFCVVIFVLCTGYWFQAYSESWRSNTVWRARLWIPYLSMPVGLGLLVLQYIADLLCVATGRTPPFGLRSGTHADEAALAQARQALEEAP
jgi:TRAP-type C4-dicarboxylate transport system permease small subunit